MGVVEKEQAVDPTGSPHQVGDRLRCRVHCRQVGDSKREDHRHRVEGPEDSQ